MTFSHTPPLHGGQHTEGLCHTHPTPPFTRWTAQDTSPGEAWVPICFLRMRFFFPFCIISPNSLSVINAKKFHRRHHERQTNGCTSHRCNVRFSYVGWDSALPLQFWAMFVYGWIKIESWYNSSIAVLAPAHHTEKALCFKHKLDLALICINYCEILAMLTSHVGLPIKIHVGQHQNPHFGFSCFVFGVRSFCLVEMQQCYMVGTCNGNVTVFQFGSTCNSVTWMLHVTFM